MPPPFVRILFIDNLVFLDVKSWQLLQIKCVGWITSVNTLVNVDYGAYFSLNFILFLHFECVLSNYTKIDIRRCSYSLGEACH
jgi:hypothetical protein